MISLADRRSPGKVAVPPQTPRGPQGPGSRGLRMGSEGFTLAGGAVGQAPVSLRRTNLRF
jgi:hypothetical protein